MKNHRAENTTHLVRLGQAFEDNEHLLSRASHRLCVFPYLAKVKIQTEERSSRTSVRQPGPFSVALVHTVKGKSQVRQQTRGLTPLIYKITWLDHDLERQSVTRVFVSVLNKTKSKRIKFNTESLTSKKKNTENR